MAAPLATALAVPAAVPAEAQVRAAAHLSVIRGVVTDAAGHRVAGVQVTAVPYGSLADPRSTTTGRSGGFRVAAGPGDFTLQVHAGAARGGESDARGYFDPDPDGPLVHVAVGTVRAGVRIRLQAAGTVVGRVTDPHGHGLTGVLPYLQPVLDYATGSDEYAADDPTVTVRASRNGWFRITGVTPGAYEACSRARYQRVIGGASDAHGYGGACRPAAVSVTGGATTRLDGHLTLWPLSGATLVGRVVGPDRTPVRDVEVASGDWDTTTGADGRYWIHGLTPGTHRVCLRTAGAAGRSHTGYAGHCLTVRAHQVRHVTTALAPGAAVQGVVTGAHGSPLEGAPVEVLRGNAYEGPTTTTDAAGRYRVADLTPGRGYQICVQTDFSTAAGSADPTGGVPRCVGLRKQVTLPRARTTRVRRGAARGRRGARHRPRPGRPPHLGRRGRLRGTRPIRQPGRVLRGHRRQGRVHGRRPAAGRLLGLFHRRHLLGEV